MIHEYLEGQNSTTPPEPEFFSDGVSGSMSPFARWVLGKTAPTPHARIVAGDGHHHLPEATVTMSDRHRRIIRTTHSRRVRRRPNLEIMEGRQLLTTITVNTLVDENAANATTSLREAIDEAVRTPGDEVITFASHLSGEIDLDLGTLAVFEQHAGDRLTIRASAGVTAIDGQGKSGVFAMFGAFTDITLEGLTIKGGNGDHGFYGPFFKAGGGIANAADLTLIDSTVRGNTAVDGGGIYVCYAEFSQGDLTLIRSVVEENNATSAGGGIRAVGSDSGSVKLVDSQILRNTAGDYGGGIHTTIPLELIGSTVEGNDATLRGGGIYNASTAILAEGSTVSGNDVGPAPDDERWMYNPYSDKSEHPTIGLGGGIYNSGDLTLDHATVVDNYAGQGGGWGNVYFPPPSGEGGGIYSTGELSLVDSTVSQNRADRVGGGIYNANSDSDDSSELGRTTVWGNTAGDQGGGIYNANGSVLVATNTTISGNEAEAGFDFGGLIGAGAGVYNAGLIDFDHVTITANKGTFDTTNAKDQPEVGSGIWSEGATRLTNSIVAGNTTIWNYYGRPYFGYPDDLRSVGYRNHVIGVYNHFGDASWLGPLRDNGGPTLSHMPALGSPVINAASPFSHIFLPVDQRGQSRGYFTGRSDLGAVEAPELILVDDDIPDLIRPVDDIPDLVDLFRPINEIPPYFLYLALTEALEAEGLSIG